MNRAMHFGGNWYPKGRGPCESAILDFGEGAPGKSGIYGVVPHAGWVYSGALAGRVFHALAGGAETELVVVIGGHLRADDPVVAMCGGSWETPFGPFEMDGRFRPVLEKLGRVFFEEDGRVHPDNSTELQLPFARFFFPKARLLSLRLPPSPMAIEVGRALAEFLTTNRIAHVVVASTDLTHYGENYGFQPKGSGSEALDWVRAVNDPAFIGAVESGDSGAILDSARQNRNACSPGAVAALNEIAGAAGKRFKSLGDATSAEMGLRDQRNFVGYLGGLYA